MTSIVARRVGRSACLLAQGLGSSSGRGDHEVDWRICPLYSVRPEVQVAGSMEDSNSASGKGLPASRGPVSLTSSTVTLQRRVAAGAFWSTANFGIAILLGLPLTVLLVRLMSPRQYGAFAIATAIASLAAMLAGFGLSGAVAQAASATDSDGSEAALVSATAAGLVIARRVAVAVGVGAVPLVVVVWATPTLRASTGALLVLLPTIVVAPFAAVFIGVLLATFAARRAAAVNISALLAVGFCTFVALATGYRSALDIALARSLGLLLGFAALYWALSTSLRTIFRRRTLAHSVPLLPFAFAMLLNTVAWTAVSQLDIFFVGVELGATQAGLYAPISRVADVAIGLASALASYLLPALVRVRGEKGGVARLYHWTSLWSLVILAPLLGLMLVSPSALLDVLFGARFSDLSEPARILGLGVTLNVLFGFNV